MSLWPIFSASKRTFLISTLLKERHFLHLLLRTARIQDKSGVKLFSKHMLAIPVWNLPNCKIKGEIKSWRWSCYSSRWGNKVLQKGLGTHLTLHGEHPSEARGKVRKSIRALPKADQANWKSKEEEKQHLGRELVEEILLGLIRQVNLRQLHQRSAAHLHKHEAGENISRHFKPRDMYEKYINQAN